MIFPESALAHKYLDGLTGIEIGGSAHNPFGLNTLNVDITDSLQTPFKQKEIELCGKALPVDVVADGASLPFAGNAFDFVISSHVIEHFFDPVGALLEWARVARKYIFLIVPHRMRTFDSDREPTPVIELHNRHHRKAITAECRDGHFTVFEPHTFLELCSLCGLKVVEVADPDDKVGNGFAVIIKLD